MNDTVILEHVSKRFKRTAISERTTLKDAILKGQIFKKRESRNYFEAIRDISFSVPESTVLGLIGPNGAGKSTLLRLIAGIYRPSSGRIETRGRISALLSLGLGFHPEFSGRENILISGLALGLSREEVRRISGDIIEFAELEEFIDAPMRTYSSGMYMRLAFSVAVNVNPDILLVDEVLAVGDATFAKKSRARMEEYKNNGKTIILATHDMTTVENWCQKALFLLGGRIYASGDPKMVVAAYKNASSSAAVKLLGFGKGANFDTSAAGDYFVLCRYQPEISGSVNAIKISCSGAGSIKLAIYADKGGEPDAQLRALNTGTAVLAGWNVIPFPSTEVSTHRTYWLGYCADSAIVGAKSTTCAARRFKPATYEGFSFPDRAGTDFSSDTTYLDMISGLGSSG